jgi:hypothetical protein
MAQPVDDDDDFGDFEDIDYAAKPLENGNHGKIEPSSGDDFGAFTASSTPGRPPQSGETTVLVDSNLEGLGDLDCTPVPRNGSGDGSGVLRDLMDSTGQSTAACVDEPQGGIDESDNDAKTEAVPGNGVTAANPNSYTPDSSSVGGYDTAREDPDESTPAQNELDDFEAIGEATYTKSDEQIDEAFGDFNDGAELETPVAALELTDPFGDFGSTPACPETATRPADEFGGFDGASAVPNSTNSDPVDDFGDFDGAPASFGDVGSTAEGTAGTQGTAESESADDFGDFGSELLPEADATADDFGDFGGADSTQVTTKSTSDNGIGDIGTALVTEGATTTDGVGDSGSANATQGTHETTSADDSSDFGDFDSAPSTMAGVSDDFGEFGRTPNAEAYTEPLSTNNHSSQDDFGDFESSRASDSAPVQHATCDDFGDFNDSVPGNESTPVAEEIEADDFGNFASYGEADLVQPAQQEQNSATVSLSSKGFKPASVTKPQPMHEAVSALEKSQPVFATVFKKYALDESTKDLGGPSDAITVESLVVSGWSPNIMYMFYFKHKAHTSSFPL